MAVMVFIAVVINVESGYNLKEGTLDAEIIWGCRDSDVLKIEYVVSFTISRNLRMINDARSMS